MLQDGGNGRPRSSTFADEESLPHQPSFSQAKRASALFGAKARAISKVFDAASRREPKVPNSELLPWVLFGVSGWWSCNCVFAESPFFVVRLPAAEKLGNQLSLMTQMGNIFLISYKLLETRLSLEPALVIHQMMAMAFASLVACAFLWDQEAEGQSIPLLACMFMAGGVGCLSNSTYWALMIAYPRVCTKAVGLGMSLGGVLSSVLAALQLSGRPVRSPRFGACAFFLTAAAFQAAWWVVVALQMRGRPRVLRRVSADDLSAGGSQESLLSNGHKSERVPDAEEKLLRLGSFLVHAATYTVPSLLPFVASSFAASGLEQQMLLWMLLLQQAGESTGRIAAPSKANGAITVFAFVCLAVVFFAFLVFAVHPRLVLVLFPTLLAQVILPLMSFLFFFSYGVSQTALFLRARSLVADVDTAAEIASTMGFLGQMGALAANVVASVCVNA
uniref:Uncharacterized protein n=1 Tax=Zooxanthella nutricula TaxID=1333877 RepID=A0A7S2IXL7_9DINO